MIGRARTLMLAFFLVLAPTAGAWAGANTAKGEWENVSGTMMTPSSETVPAVRLVAAAYGFFWVMVAGFVVTVWRRQQQVEQELSELRRRIEEAAAARRS